MQFLEICREWSLQTFLNVKRYVKRFKRIKEIEIQSHLNQKEAYFSHFLFVSILITT